MMNLQLYILFPGGMGGGFQSDPVKRDNNGSISFNPIHDAALARVQKKGRNVTQSSLSNQGLRNNTSLESGEWTCIICTLHNPVRVSISSIEV